MRQVGTIALLSLLLTLLPQRLSAQGSGVVRGDCTPEVTADLSLTRGLRRNLPAMNQTWDSTRVYHQMVILISFLDVDFQMEDPQAVYDSIFNYRGYNQRQGKGCVADYFRDQSDGLFNLSFDVFGPVRVDQVARLDSLANENTRNYGGTQFRKAASEVIAQHPDIDYTRYDWNGDQKIEQVIYVYAGLCGNQGKGSYGYIWPNTNSFATLTTPDGVRISNYTSSGELWKNGASCGIGTICHEFTHSLGLPDIYPTSNDGGYSVCDEWDLMDGGNFTNYGWCPPNFTPTEKMLLGWLTPVVLTEPTSVRDLKPSAEGGEVYQISHSDSECLLLENRQQRGWDLGVPGKGLVVYHVNYDRSVWQGNKVNFDKDRRRFELVNADNMDYDAWDTLIGADNSPYVNKYRMNSAILSTSPYPWTTDSTSFVNDELTDTSVPAVRMNYPNAEGSMALSKPITNIRMSEDGLISFDFMGGSIPDGVTSLPTPLSSLRQYFNLQGQQVTAPGRGVFIVDRKKVIIH